MNELGQSLGEQPALGNGSAEKSPAARPEGEGIEAVVDTQNTGILPALAPDPGTVKPTTIFAQTTETRDDIFVTQLDLPEDLLPHAQYILSKPKTRIIVPDEYREAVGITDHTLLGGNVTTLKLIDLCWEALIVDPTASSVCVQGGENARQAKEILRVLALLLNTSTTPKVCAVGERHFPKTPLSPITESGEADRSQLPGTAPLEAKIKDAKEAMEHADIFDMVLNTHLLLEGNTQKCVDEILEIRRTLDKKDPNMELRVICSTGMLRRIGGTELVKTACEMVNEAAKGSKNSPTTTTIITMKTETGFITKPNDPKGERFGATMEDATLMSETLDPHVGIKLSGGVSLKNAQEMIAAAKSFSPNRRLYIGASGLVGNFGKELLRKQQLETEQPPRGNAY